MDSIFSINQDSFIYAVRQAFDARSKPAVGFNSHLKYTPFLDKTWEKPAETSISALEQPLNEIFKHHWAAIPYYQRYEKVNLENIAWFALSMATLFADIDFLLNSVLGHGIPQKNQNSTEIWALISTAVENSLHEYSDLFYAYAEWKYTPQTDKKDVVDWNVRPPCGLLYKTEFKALFDEIRNARYGNRGAKQHGKGPSRSGESTDSSKGQQQKDKREQRESQAQRGSHELQEKRESQEVHGQRESKEMRSPREPQELHDQRESNEMRGPRESKEVHNQRESKELHGSHESREFRKSRESRKPRQHVQTDYSELLQPALEECKKAIEMLKGNPNIHEIPLSAQNSFIRRHQHTAVTEAGFDSDSRGEGAGRHVCLVRKSTT